MIWYDMIWYDMIWYDTIWYDMIWYDMILYDMIWYDDIYLIAVGWHPVAVVQYTSTHKLYTEHNETEYLEWNIDNNKNT